MSTSPTAARSLSNSDHRASTPPPRPRFPRSHRDVPSAAASLSGLQEARQVTLPPGSPAAFSTQQHHHRGSFDSQFVRDPQQHSVAAAAVGPRGGNDSSVARQASLAIRQSSASVVSPATTQCEDAGYNCTEAWMYLGDAIKDFGGSIAQALSCPTLATAHVADVKRASDEGCGSWASHACSSLNPYPCMEGSVSLSYNFVKIGVSPVLIGAAPIAGLFSKRYNLEPRGLTQPYVLSAPWPDSPDSSGSDGPGCCSSWGAFLRFADLSVVQRGREPDHSSTSTAPALAPNALVPPKSEPLGVWIGRQLHDNPILCPSIARFFECCTSTVESNASAKTPRTRGLNNDSSSGAGREPFQGEDRTSNTERVN